MTQNNNLDELIQKNDKLDYLLDAISGNLKKFHALPSEVQKILKPYKDKIEKGEALTKKDYEELKKKI